MTDLPPLGDAPLKQAPQVDAHVPGFQGAGVPAGLRKDGRADLALIAAPAPVPVAGVFTSNLLAAAPVQVSREHIASGQARAILANSGGANAATGAPGLEAAKRSCAAVAQALGCSPRDVLLGSTGVIGQLLDAAKIEASMPALKADLSPDGLARAAGAIMTTDVFRKMARADIELDGRPVAVLGMAKGAGMIRPSMIPHATMLAFVLTDAVAGPAALKEILAGAVEQSFNRASVDGDTSTNDTLLLLAGGHAGNQPLAPGHPQLPLLAAAVTRVCQDLAAMMVADGEGAEHLIRVRVTGAPDDEQARAHAYAVAHSPLCKTAFAGKDANWGRLFSTLGASAGRQGWAFAPERFNLWIGPAHLAKDGLYNGPDQELLASQTMRQPRYEIRLDLGLGSGHFWVLTCDLGHAYVQENADYRS
jgi:glutamate N-acetyltransferase/amino-acid N-acetyltransferase